MTFKLSSEQQQLRDSALRFAREHANFERWQRTVVAGSKPESETWRRMAELGWLGIAVREEHDGLGGSPFDTMVLMEALGTGFIAEPLVSTCVLAPRLLENSTSASVTSVLSRIPQGEAIVALALGEADGDFDLANVDVRARRDGDRFVVNGLKCHVPDGVDATHVVVPVRTSGSGSEPIGITLLLIDSNSSGLSKSAFRSIDHRAVAEMRFDDVAVPADQVLGSIDQGLEPLEHAVDYAIVAELAEALGAMEAAAELTLAYVKVRQQFGTAIGSFQAVQHRMADIAIACEEARSLVYYATGKLSQARAARRRAVSAAKTRVGQCALFVGHQCVQLHGGIGTSDEMAVSHIMRRVRMLDMHFGNADFHRAVFAATSHTVS